MSEAAADALRHFTLLMEWINHTCFRCTFWITRCKESKRLEAEFEEADKKFRAHYGI